MNVGKIATHVADAQARLAQQYRGQPRMLALVAALVRQVQLLEDALYGIDAGRRLSGAVGAQLDALGQILGTARNGMDDTAYRFSLMAAIAENYSDGTAPALLNIVKTLFQAAVVFMETPNAVGMELGPTHAALGLAVGSPGIPDSAYSMALGTLLDAISAGIGLYTLSVFDAGGVFSMAGPSSWVRGFGDKDDPSAGAPMASIVYSNPAL